jgi:hypothetical protein
MSKEAGTLSAKKAAKTRARNRAQLEHYLKIVQPRMLRIHIVSTLLLKAYRPNIIHLKWDEARAGYKLRKGAEYGTLVGFVKGSLWLVRPDGYKRAQVYDPAYWEVLVP